MRARSEAPKRSVFFFSSLLVQRERVAEAGLGFFFFFLGVGGGGGCGLLPSKAF